MHKIDTYTVSVTKDDMTLHFYDEACGELRVSTQESDDEVRLTVWQLYGEGDACIGSTSPPVSLVRPLADRQLVDDLSGEVVEATRVGS